MQKLTVYHQQKLVNALTSRLCSCEIERFQDVKNELTKQQKILSELIEGKNNG